MWQPGNAFCNAAISRFRSFRPVQPVKKAKKKNKQVAPTQSYSEDDFARDWGDGEDGPPGKKGGKKNKTKDKGKRKAKDEPQFDAFASLEANESVDLE